MGLKTEEELLADDAIKSQIAEMQARGMPDEAIIEKLTEDALGADPDDDASVAERGFFSDLAGVAADALGGGGDADAFLGKLGMGDADALLEKLGVENVIGGIKEALCVGIKSAVELCGKKDGFLGNAKIKISAPKSLRLVEAKARALGFEQVCDDFNESLNRAAESAAPKSVPVVTGAIQEMTIDDVKHVWQGGDDSATVFMRSTCNEPLKVAMREVCDESLASHQVTKYFHQLVELVKDIPVVGPFAAKFKIHDYVLQSCLDGLFTLMVDQEQMIRKDPVHRTSELLQGVFGLRDRDLNLIGPDALPAEATATTRPCKNGCGREAFEDFTTCCTHCHGPEGPHARGCKEVATMPIAAPPAGYSAAAAAPAAPQCSGGCGRLPFQKFPTCCTHCQGPHGPHAHDCDTRASVSQ